MPRIVLDWEQAPTSTDGAQLNYNLHEYPTDFEAWAAVRDNSPLLYLGFIRGKFEVTRANPTLHRGVVPYIPFGQGGSTIPEGQTPPTTASAGSSTPGENDALDGAWSFDWAGGTKHITQSLETFYARKPGDPVCNEFSQFLDPDDPLAFGSAPLYNRAIGVTPGPNGKVAGCDVFSPVSTFTRNVARTQITMKYIKTVDSIIGKVNAAEFCAREARSVMLTGCSIKHLKGFDWSASFTFTVRPSALWEEVISPGLPEDACSSSIALYLPYVGGFDHVWAFYDGVLQGFEVVPQARAVYVEKVVKEADFDLLKLGS